MSTFNKPAHAEEGLSLAKTRLEARSFETPVRQAHRLLRMSGRVLRAEYESR
jgi:hypothetical protein